MWGETTVTGAGTDGLHVTGLGADAADTVSFSTDSTIVIIDLKFDIIASKKGIDTKIEIYYTQTRIEPRRRHTSPTKHLYWLALNSTYNCLSIPSKNGSPIILDKFIPHFISFSLLIDKFCRFKEFTITILMKVNIVIDGKKIAKIGSNSE